MKFTPVDKQVIDGLYRKENSTDLSMFIDNFRESEYECVEVTDFTHKSAKSCYQSLHSHLRRHRIGTVKCMLRDNRVFLIKVKI